MNKYKRIKKYFHFSSRSNSYKKMKFARNFIFHPQRAQRKTDVSNGPLTYVFNVDFVIFLDWFHIDYLISQLKHTSMA